MREFNVTGLCIPSKHYMADISEKVCQIVAMVEKGQYFTINRARQYGKTTTLWLLDKELVRLGYMVVHISFEGIYETLFESEKNFCQSVIKQILYKFKGKKIKRAKICNNGKVSTFMELDEFLDLACKEEKIVLIIDETDKAFNSLVFLRFMGMLRSKYLLRQESKNFTFQSVILCGVRDIKNPKIELAQSSHYQLLDSERYINSPWNIATNFEVEMSFSASEIATILNEYEKDYKIGIDIKAISEEVRAYTNGHPFLVSWLCKIIDEDLGKDWTINGVQNSVKLILEKGGTLFDDIIKNMESSKEFFNLLHRIIISGERFIYNNLNPAISFGVMFGILSNKDGAVAVHNRIFELFICEYFISLKKTGWQKSINKTIVSEIIENGKFNMALTIEKFMQHYYELYNKSNEKFLDSECWLLFLTFLRPLINGAGFYHIESTTRNLSRIDLIIDYGSEQFIVELKIWHGEQKHEKAHEQLIAYLNSKNKSDGYLLTFDFRKRRAKKPSAKWVRKGKKKFLDCLCV